MNDLHDRIRFIHAAKEAISDAGEKTFVEQFLRELGQDQQLHLLAQTGMTIYDMNEIRDEFDPDSDTGKSLNNEIALILESGLASSRIHTLIEAQYKAWITDNLIALLAADLYQRAEFAAETRGMA